MKYRAEYWALRRDGQKIRVCAYHRGRIARKLDDEGRFALKRGFCVMGSMPDGTRERCDVCRKT